MFRTRVACGRNPRTAEAPRPLRLFEQCEGPRCSKYIAFCPSFQDAFPRFRERSWAGTAAAAMGARLPPLSRAPRSHPRSSIASRRRPNEGACPPSSLHPSHSPPSSLHPSHSPPRHPASVSSPAPPHRSADRSGRAFSRREASRACAPKRAQSGMIRLKHKETRPSSRPPPRSIRPLPPIARNEQVGFCRHFGRE